ncbi:MAG: oligosaccharide flippase family protein [Nitrosomonadales bacterium]|nr:oligosaccharide flippase family protein [Nitrosomonadales bacterium]
MAVFLTGLITLALVPRALGPEAFGRYEFLTNFFLQVKSFFDMGTSACFYTRLSQRQGDTGLVAFYHKLLFWASVLMIGGALLLAGTPLGNLLWVGEGALLVSFAASYAAVTWWLDTTRKIVDARHLTVRGETLYAFSRIVTTLILVAIVWGWSLRIEGYFIYQIITLLLTVAVLTHLLNKHALPSADKIAPQPARTYIREFWNYSHPLIAHASVGMLVIIAERWILQTQAGAIEQGFYGLASQVAVMCFLFTSAMTQLLTREFAVAWDQQNMERMRSMFRRIIPMLYAVAAYFSVFIACHAEDVVWLLGGQAWKEGVLAMSIMVLYPMHQTYGQLSGSVFYATGQTRLYRNIGITGMVAGLPVMLWLVLPVESGGLGLGAAGLVLKMVVLQFILVNVQLWFNTRLLSLSFWKLLAHQLVVPAVFLACVFAGSTLVSFPGLPRLGQFLLTGMAYTFLVVVIILLIPQLAGLQRGEIGAAARKVWGK